MSHRFFACWMITLPVFLAGFSHPNLSLRGAQGPDHPEGLQVGFGETDITPELGTKPVYLAGFGKNRKATGFHDPIMARAMVLAHDKTKIAIVSVDLVGLFHPFIEELRQRLPGFAYLLVSSTHNHEGPDSLGLWGPNTLQSGIDPDYMKKVAQGIVATIQKADGARRPATARIGRAKAPELLHDARLPIVKHDELVALQFLDGSKTAGIVVQWNCHPETLDSRNTQISADFVGATVAYLKGKYHCPVIYLTGTVGGLMTSLHVPVRNSKGDLLSDGTFEKTERYGRLVGELAEKALSGSQAVQLFPIEARTATVFLPMDNPFYHLAWKLGVVDRQAFGWTGDATRGDPLKDRAAAKGKLAVRTEIGYLKLGELEIAAIPGEIYPELVLGKVQDPADPGADFPDAPIEPSIYGQLKGTHRMLIGLANDELGYIIPKRQWDEKAPFCYGRKTAQYGEMNSLGPETAPLLCAAFRELVRRKKE
ncbi:MAG TPA: neutral/alkaline non-lysosomal ceramidase N-terminal domain-containing protein [Gemmataceae bacterium]|nr:neutral/alkaline non-lysosomal ceramidase N-terminal domain-containing protein [Gemmataceae bacterium]